MREPGSEDRIWWSDTDAEISEEHFDGLSTKVVSHLEDGDLYVIDAFCGADPKHRLAVRILTAHPYHALFGKTMFIDPAEADMAGFEPDVLVLHEPEVEADSARDAHACTRPATCIATPSGDIIVTMSSTYAGKLLDRVVGDPAGAVPQGVAGDRVGAGRAADAEVDPPGVRRLQQRELLGHDERRVVGQHHAARADADPLGGGGDHRDQDRRVGGGDRRHVVVLGQPVAR